MRHRLTVIQEAAETPLSATRRVIDEIKALDRKGQRAGLRFLGEWRKDVVSRIAGAKDFEAFRLPVLLRDIDSAALDWAERYGIELRSLLREGFDVGIRRVDLPIGAAGIEVSLPAVSLSHLAASQRFSMNLVRDISTAGARAIRREVLLGFNGAKTPFQVFQAVGRNLDDPSVFGTTANRALTVTRTEMGRIQSISTQARQEQAARSVRGLKKQWRWSGLSRSNHAAANGQIREVTEPFDIPGGPRCAAEQLMFPRDPSGSACNTVNCGCESLPYKEDWNLDDLTL